MNSTALLTANDHPPLEVFANGGRVWLAERAGTTVWASLRTAEEVEELITALEISKLPAWPELKTNATK